MRELIFTLRKQESLEQPAGPSDDNRNIVEYNVYMIRLLLYVGWHKFSQ